jgi:hypothetical protein
MPLATYKDLCIDAVQAGEQTRFWAEVLGLDPHRQENGDGELRTDDGRVAVWVNTVAQPKTVKNRVHLDVNAESVQQVVDAGATTVAEHPRWTTLADPDGQEFCVFVREEPIEQRLYELVWNCAEGPEASHAQAAWWQGVLGGEVVDDKSGYSWLKNIPATPFYSMDFVGVPEPKTTKNRVHLDVTTDDVDALVAHGARVLREPDDEIGWHVLADPEGNEFCAFTRR